MRFTGNTMIFRRYDPLNTAPLVEGEEPRFLKNHPINYSIVKDSWTIDLRKTHKQKGRTMWVKSEDKINIFNITEFSRVGIFPIETKEEGIRHQVGVTMGYSGVQALKTFKYKEDAERYLDELLEKLNDED